MKTISVHAAMNLPGTGSVEGCTLYIEEDRLPAVSSLKEAEQFHEEEAERVLEALKSLPQGTRYALLLKLLADAKVFYQGP